jgi:A/G-specific adenine glycosylase
MSCRAPVAETAPREAAALRRALLGWFDRERRELPWRATRDPWAILVSEVMLQQTTVSAALPYYERFLSRWPTAARLSRAGLDELLAEWAGLGYYSRARKLHAAAGIVAEAGALPSDSAGLRELPGVGPYTAAAVASIAYGEPIAAVDGNVERVICRLLALAGPPTRAAVRQRIAAAAQALLDPRRPGDHNQAMMELGATLCRPKSPRCGECPASAHCAAFASGEPQRYPRPKARPQPVDVLRAAAIVRRGGQVLLRRREQAPNEGFLELPEVTVERRAADGAAPPAARLRRALAAHLRREHGLQVELLAALPLARHTITRHRIATLPLLARLRAGRVRAPLQWAALTTDVPITTSSRRLIAVAQVAAAGEAS